MTSGPQLVAGLFVAIAASYTAHIMSVRKERSRLWSVFSFFLPFLVLLLALLPPRAVRGEEERRAQPCFSCNNPVSPAAKTCPHCGQPKPLGIARNSHRKRIEFVGVSIILAVIAAFVWNTSHNGPEQTSQASEPDSFPACDSDEAKRNVEHALDTSPSGKIQGLSIVQWKSESSLSATTSDEQCAAVVLMNDAQAYQASYRFFKQNGQTLVEFHFTP